MRKGMIMGSETEFGLIPTSGRWKHSDGLSRIRSFLNELDAFLYPRATSSNDLKNVKSIEVAANWWKEDLESQETEENHPKDLEVLRRLGLTGSYISNGARVYVDCNHSEYSSPECSSPLELIAYERAGEMVMRTVVSQVAKTMGVKVDLLKRNWNRKSKTSYACHENYLLSRKLFDKITGSGYFQVYSSREQEIWAFYLITSQIFTGLGRFDASLGWPQGFSFSQRQPFIQNFLHNNTVKNRAIINLRDRPYADQNKWGRLHVICRDGNRADWSNFLKYGTSALVLLMLEDLDRWPFLDGWFYTKNPVESFVSVKNEKTQLRTKNGVITALEGQIELLSRIADWYSWRSHEGAPIDWAPFVLNEWSNVLQMIAVDDDRLRRRLDTYIKKNLFAREVTRGKSLQSLNSLDYSYHVVGSGSLFDHLLEHDRVDVLIGQAEIESALTRPPRTRAMLRSKLTQLWADRPKQISWHFIRLDGYGNNGIIKMPNPGRQEFLAYDGGLKKEIEQALESDGDLHD